MTTPTQALVDALPHPGSPEASAMIDSVLDEYEWPSNAKNAARAGYVAAKRLLRATQQAKHAAHCNLNFPATLGTDEDHCSCGATQQAPASEPVERNDPLSALSIRLLVHLGKVSQDDANEAFHLACTMLQKEAEEMNVKLPWVVVPHPSAQASESAEARDDWRQYATEREDTAQQVIERHRKEHESLLRLLAQARTEQGRAYRCIQGMHNALARGISFSAEAYHAPTIGAAKRYVFEGAIDGSDFFVGKPVEVLHAALALPGDLAPQHKEQTK